MFVAEDLTVLLLKQLVEKHPELKSFNDRVGLSRRFFGLAQFVEFYLDSNPRGLLQQTADAAGVDRKEMEHDIVAIVRRAVLERKGNGEEANLNYA